MRSVKFLVAAGAASLLSSAAFAADMAIAPPPMPYAAPVADFGGWYLRGDIGMTNQSMKSLDNPDPNAALSQSGRDGLRQCRCCSISASVISSTTGSGPT